MNSVMQSMDPLTVQVRAVLIIYRLFQYNICYRYYLNYYSVSIFFQSGFTYIFVTCTIKAISRPKLKPGAFSLFASTNKSDLFSSIIIQSFTPQNNTFLINLINEKAKSTLIAFNEKKNYVPFHRKHNKKNVYDPVCVAKLEEQKKENKSTKKKKRKNIRKKQKKNQI